MFGTDKDEETRKLEEDEERARRREKEKVIWDGHTSSKAATLDKFQNSGNMDDQIAAIHKAAGLKK
jgi:splicing factor 3A subunit 1